MAIKINFSHFINLWAIKNRARKKNRVEIALLLLLLQQCVLLDGVKAETSNTLP